jgi:hypothetical protein
MFTFAIRPGYKSKELLIEFRLGSGDDEMIEAMKEALAKINAELVEKIDLWQNDEIIYRMKSNYGGFEISSDNYGNVFILAPSNQAAITAIGLVLASSPSFKEVVVNHEQYA